MLICYNRLEGFKGFDLFGKCIDELGVLFSSVLGEGLYGFCYSVYDEGQELGFLFIKV